MFKRSDRDGIIVVLLIALVAVIAFSLLDDKTEGTTERFDNKDSATLSRRNVKQQYYAQPAGKAAETFPFDPNTADSTILLRLGLKPWQVRSIYRYRAKGGRFRYKEDFAQLYGLTLEDYRRLEHYICIEPVVMAADVIQRPQNGAYGNSQNRNGQNISGDSATHCNNGNSATQVAKVQKIRQEDPPVDINTADTNELKKIPGIGSYFARRIVELRQRRQAFLSPEDLLTIRNFPETALVYMTASQNFERIHINKATLQQLRAHPLINYTQATDILKYRRTNGDIHSEKDISFIPSFTKEQLQRLIPYLLFD